MIWGKYKFNYYLGLNKFVTDGISAMNDNDEKDQYKNDNIVANIGYKINENFKIQNSFRIADTFYEYDAVDKSYTDINDSTDNLEASYSLKLVHEKNKFKIGDNIKIVESRPYSKKKRWKVVDK